MKMIDYNLLKGKIAAMQSTEPEYAFNFLNNALNPSTEWECIEDMLDNMEVYEAEPVKHGRCVIDNEGYERCSVCNEHETGIRYFTFCPRCGAKIGR